MDILLLISLVFVITALASAAMSYTTFGIILGLLGVAIVFTAFGLNSPKGTAVFLIIFFVLGIVTGIEDGKELHRNVGFYMCITALGSSIIWGVLSRFITVKKRQVGCSESGGFWWSNSDGDSDFGGGGGGE